MNRSAAARRMAVAVACSLGIPCTHAATWDWDNTTGNWSDPLAWTPDTLPLSAADTVLRFGGLGDVAYTSTNDLAGSFQLNGLELNSSATVEEIIAASAGGTLDFVANGGINPAITQNGTGAFRLNPGILATGPLSLGGAGTGLVTFGGTISGGGGLTFTGGNWRLTNAGSNFTGGITIGTGAFVELAPGAAINITPGAATILGGNTSANVITINGGTLKFTTPGNITFGDNRALTFGVNGGVLDLRNSGAAGTGNIANSGTNDLALTLNNTAANPAVIRFNGGQNGLSTNTTNNGDWSANNNTLRVESYAGTGRLRVELENGAFWQNRAGTVNVPVTVRGVVGGDPTSGPMAAVNANISRNTGRVILDNAATHNYAQGLILEGALQFSPAGQARGLDGNLTLASGAFVSFNGRGTGTALGAPLTAPGGNVANTQHPIYVGIGGNDTLTIQNGAIAALDSRIRHEQTNNNAALLNSRAIIQGGGELRITQSLSRATAAAAAAAANQINTNSTTSVVGHHIIDGDIQGEGTSANEAVLSIYLPAPAGTDSDGDQIPDTDSFGDLGGVVFRNNSTTTTAGTNGSDLIINGSGFGGLRVEGRARPNLLFNTSGSVSDPVSNVSKVANLLTAQRLSALAGNGGYLTPAPAGGVFDLPLGGEWSGAVSVGLRAIDSNPAGVDVSLAQLSGFNHNLAVDPNATLDLGAASPFVIGGAATLHGRGAVTSTGSMIVDTNAFVSPGLNDLGTLSVTTGNFALSGGLSIEVQGNQSDRLAITGDMVLGGNLALTGSYGTTDLTIATYSGTLIGGFSVITGLSPLFDIDYGTGTNSSVRLVYNTSPTITWEGAPGATWSVGGGNWKAGATFADGTRVLFDGSATGSTSVTISGSDVKPLATTVNTDTKSYTITSSAGAALSGSGPLTKTGSMILTMIGSATYTGGTVVSAGTLALGNADALPDTGAIEIAAGATLDTQGNNDTLGDLSVSGSVIGGGTLAVNSLSFGSGATFSPNLLLNGGVTKSGATGTSLASAIDLNTGNRNFTVQDGSTLTVTGTISNGALTKSGPGDLVLAPLVANTFADGMTVSGGRLLAAPGAYLMNTPVAVNTGGTLEFTGVVPPMTFGPLSGTGGSIVGLNGLTLMQDTTTTFGGNITGSTSVTMAGTGAVTLSGANSFTGGLFVDSGRVALTAPGAGGGSPARVSPNGTLASGATLTTRIELLGGTLMGVGSPGSASSGEVVAAVDSTIALSDPLNPGTRSEVVLTGTLKGSGNLNVTISTNAPHPDGGVGFRLRGTAASDYSGTITAAKSVKLEVQTAQAGPFSPAGTGKFIMTGGAFTGGLNGDYSQLNIRNNFAGNTIFGNDIEVAGTGFVNMNMAGSAAADAVTRMGSLRIGSGQTIGVNKNGTPHQVLEFTSVTLTGGDATFAPTTVGFGASGTSDFRVGPIAQLAPGSGIILDGAGALTLAAPNNYTGSTTVTNGNLRIGATGALPAGTTLIANGGTVDLNSNAGSFDVTVAALSGASGTITSNDFAIPREFETNQTTDTSFGGTITGNLHFTKSGAGRLTLTGFLNPIDLSVEGGVLAVDGTSFSPVVVKNGGILGGIGSLTTVTVEAGGKVAPGASPGRLTATDVTFQSGSALEIEVGKTTLGGPPLPSDYDSLNITGVAALNGPALSLTVGAGIEIDDIFTIILRDGAAVTGSFAGLGNGDSFFAGGQQFQISYFDDSATPNVLELAGGNDVSLLAVPEPGGAALLMGGLACMAGLRRRRSI